MFTDNRTIYIKREIMGVIARLFFSGRLVEEIDRLPAKIIRRKDTPHRCCIQKDREIVRQRAVSALGFGLENEDEIDEKLLSDFAREALAREKIESPILTFISEGCNSCVKVNYYVTEVCRNCVAKPCIINCPKGAITSDDTKSHIDSTKCVNCGKCLKVCPYHAIVFVPVPCEESCPTGAIHKNGAGKEEIDYDRCIFCGKCIKSCPFGAVTEKSQIIDVMKALTQKETVALVAPAAVGQFPGSIGQIAGAIKKLGFTHIAEVAVGADITAHAEAAELEERLAAGDALMGTSCCPAYVEAVRKHAKKFERYVSHARTPMAYTAELAKKKYPSSVAVFIGPCVAKRHEGLSNPDIDYVITFEELGSLFIGRDIDVAACEEAVFDIGAASAEGRNFPVCRGVSQAVIAAADPEKETGIRPVLINGLSRRNISLLNSYGEGKAPGNLIEVMSCEGGCLHGPCVVSNPVVSRMKLKEYTGIETPAP